MGAKTETETRADNLLGLLAFLYRIRPQEMDLTTRRAKTHMTDEITIYGADWCRDCRRTKHYLVRNDIDHSWVDVEANPAEIETVMAYNGGRRSIPVVVFPDGTHLTEPSDAAMDEKLGR